MNLAIELILMGPRQEQNLPQESKGNPFAMGTMANRCPDDFQT